MKKFLSKITLLYILANAYAAVAQTPEIKTDLPQIAPPSPTVAAFMKFEEVPVNYYTGIPDVTIPLYSMASHSPEVGVNLSLKYHPGSIAVDEKSSFVGLGWSLFGGGTISRTVRGIPDDLVYNGSTYKKSRYGIYDTDRNKYYQVMDSVGSSDSLTIGITNQIRSEFLWNAYEQGALDTEHDLYQFNFMGYTGRFIISKRTGSYEVIKLDNDNPVRITYDSANKTFTLFDDKGYEYIFDVKEVTTENTFSQYTYFGSTMPSGTSDAISYPYTSAFHLSKVKDRNGNTLIEYVFNTDSEIMGEVDNELTTIQNDITSVIESSAVQDITNNACGRFDMIEAKFTENHHQRSTKTKKIKQIKITDKAKIDFDLINDREDTENESAYRLRSVTVTDWAGNAIKKITLEHNYSFVNNNNRMMLTKVMESDPLATTSVSYEMDYVAPLYSSYGKDYWGYFTKQSLSYPSGIGLFREATKTACKVDALQKMRLPSGGAVIFNFESNTYSYMGDSALTDFSQNPDNYNYSTSSTGNMTTVSGYATYNLPVSSAVRYAKFLPQIISGQAGTFTLYKVVGGSDQEVMNFSCGSTGSSCGYTPEVTLAANATYKIKYATFTITGTNTGKSSIWYRTLSTTQLQYMYGGGIRIKNIGYFEDGSVDPQYYEGESYQNGMVPQKQKDFNYSFFDNASKSSGSLVFPKPVFEYSLDKHYYWQCNSESGLPIDVERDYTFKTVTDFNNLKVLRTHGADVGYKNITVSETGNGLTRYEYKSPIDVPEAGYTLSYPFLASNNYDYKRGLLRKEQVYNQAGTLLQETINDYETVSDSISTGFSVSSSNNCRYSYKYATHAIYYNRVNNCITNGTDCYRTCDYPFIYIDAIQTRDYFGWTKLIGKTVNEYLNGQLVQTKEHYTYNSFNKQIASQTVETYGSAETIETKYFYHTYANNVIGRISHIETRKNGTLTDTQKMLYSTFPGNSTYLPATVQTAKSMRTLENRVQFVKYDEFGNLLEVKKENGTSVVYIWGYNKTLPIAMIENATYAGISSTLIINAQTASNGTNETTLTTALTALRTGIPNAMVTTYIHKPGVGITSMTDPKGDKTTFTYDVMGRLLYVKDKYDNLLSENEYHYKMP